jgi:hypothetical protein
MGQFVAIHELVTRSCWFSKYLPDWTLDRSDNADCAYLRQGSEVHVDHVMLFLYIEGEASMCKPASCSIVCYICAWKPYRHSFVCLCTSPGTPGIIMSYAVRLIALQFVF